MMRKRVLKGLLIVSIVIFGVICYFAYTMQNGSNGLVQEEESVSEVNEYTLYVLTPITGQLSYIGEPVSWVAEYAENIINESGGIRGKSVNIVPLDTEFNNLTVNSLEDEYISDQRFFIGPVDAPGTSEGLEFVTENKIPNIAAYSYQEIREKAEPYGISYMSDSSEGEIEAVETWKGLNPDIENVVIFVNPSEESQVSTAKLFEEILPDMGMEVLDTIDVPTGEESQMDSIVQALNKKADGYISLVRAEDYVNIVTQLRLRGVTEGRRITASFASYDSLLLQADEYLDGTYIWNKFDVNYQGDDWQKLVEAYAEEFNGSVPNSSSIPDIYNAIMAWKQCIETLDLETNCIDLENERQQIAQWLYNSPVINGIQGDYQWKDGKKVSSMYYFQFEGSTPVSTTLEQ